MRLSSNRAALGLVLVGALGVSLLHACGGESDSGCSATDSITVLAASSLKGALEQSINDFAEVQPCVTVDLVFGSSGALASQIVSGVPADVFLSAGKKATGQVKDANLVVQGPTDFVRNSMAIMVSNVSDFVDSVSSLVDLSDARHDGIIVGLCDVDAPCGLLADSVLFNASAAYETDLSRTSIADTETNSVEGLVTRVELGEVDAGLVYSSDCVIAAQDSNVKCVLIPTDVNGKRLNDFTTYSAMMVTSGDASRAFFDFVTGEAFVTKLVGKYGFSE